MGRSEIECPAELRTAIEVALRVAGLDGHVSVELVDAASMRELNNRYRGRDEPTDVLAFPVDGPELTVGPRELGDVVVCREQADDLQEAAVHGVLHLAGYDHESDEGEMVQLQRQVLSELGEGR